MKNRWGLGHFDKLSDQLIYQVAEPVEATIHLHQGLYFSTLYNPWGIECSFLTILSIPRASERFWLVDINITVAGVASATVESAGNFNPVGARR